MPYFTTISIRTSKDLFLELDRVLEKYKDTSIYISLVGLREAVLQIYIKNYYLSKYKVYLEYIFTNLTR